MTNFIILLAAKKRVTNYQTVARVKQIFEESYSSEDDRLGGGGGAWCELILEKKA